MDGESRLIVLGRVTGTHGIRGELKIHSYSGRLETFQALRRLTLRNGDGTCETYPIGSVRRHKKWILVRFEGVDDINRVLNLVGREVVARRSELPEPDEDEFYWDDLIGLEVHTVDGRILGVLEEIFETGSNDVYAVRDGRREYLIPAIADVIVSVDLAAGRMTVAPPEGLLDL